MQAKEASHSYPEAEWPWKVIISYLFFQRV